MIRLFLIRLPIFVALLGTILMSGHALVGAVAALLALAFSAVGPKFEFTPRVELILLLASLLAGISTALLFGSDTDLFGRPALSQGWRALVLFGCFALVFRATTRGPWGGEVTTLGLSLVPVMGLGGGQSHPYYPALVLIYCCTLILGAWLQDSSRPSVFRLSLSQALVSLLSLIVAIGIGISVSRFLPILHDQAQAKVVDFLTLDFSISRSGFSSSMELGSMQSMLQSDEKVFRVSGPSTDYLRGIVYTRYRLGKWFAAPAGEIKAMPPSPMNEKSTVIEVLGDERSRLFAPLDVGDFGSARPLKADEMGLLMVSSDEVERYWFNNRAVAKITVAAPDEDDQSVPESLQARLRKIAEAATSSVSSTQKKLLDLVSHFHEHFEYSLSYERPSNEDAVLHFLETGREGHCEYFASAMALLARSLGIPTRVIGGYLVTERNQLTGKMLVRQKNAHAWLEAWVDGAWRSYDPTPPAGLALHMEKETAGFAAALDWLSERASKLLRFAKSRPVWQYVLMLVLALLYLLRSELHRWWTGRHVSKTSAHAQHQRPAAFVKSLFVWLEQQGIGKASAETLESYAIRLCATGLEGHGRAAELIRRYAAFKYGAHGDQDSLRQAVSAFLDDAPSN